MTSSENAWSKVEKDALTSYVKNNGIYETIWKDKLLAYWGEAAANDTSSSFNQTRADSSITAMAYLVRTNLRNLDAQQKERLAAPVSNNEPVLRKCDRAQKILDTLPATITAITALFESIEILISDYKEQKSMLQDLKELREVLEKVGPRIIRNGR